MMLKQFKEIDTFFKNDRFTDKELMDLKNSISSNYKDLSAVKLAFSIIELQILKFEMIINEIPNQIKPLKTVVKSKKTPTKKTPRTKKIKLVGTDGMNSDEKIEYLRNKNLLYILNEITETESKQFFLNILREKGIYKGSIGIILSPENYDEIKDKLRSILNTNKKRDSSLRIKTSHKIKINRSISKSNTVYDKIKTMNGTGKIIYIRSK
jgi:hypothetical protein